MTDIAPLLLIGTSKMIHVRTAIKTSSRAEAIVFKMELRYFKKKLATIPTAALFSITSNT